MCGAFVAALPETWTAYPETAGFDLLLVRNDGAQIGVEAKLSMNTRVVAQIIESRGSQGVGPDYRAILVPSRQRSEIDVVTDYLGITVITIDPRPHWRRVGDRHEFTPPLPGGSWSHDSWHEQMPTRRCDLPEYVPDVAAGVPAPIKLTDWKIGALKIVAIMESRGFVTRSDFKALRVDHRRWTAPGNGWLARDHDRGGYVAGKYLPDFKGHHPDVYRQIVADAEKWMPGHQIITAGAAA